MATIGNYVLFDLMNIFPRHRFPLEREISCSRLSSHVPPMCIAENISLAAAQKWRAVNKQ
jgi:hypothetical protein